MIFSGALHGFKQLGLSTAFLNERNTRFENSRQMIDFPRILPILAAMVADVEHLPDEMYDVIVIGGALAGAASATLLLRKNPGIRILIIEKSAKLTRRVGEATVEVSAYFMGHVLGMTRYLNESHISKQGLRFWFANEKVKSLDQSSEVGPRYLARLPSYQLDRASFDEEVLRRAVEAGAVIMRPAIVSNVKLEAGGQQTMQVKHGERRLTVSARWIVDASGVSALLSRKQGWWRANTEHPTAAAWSRWRGVKDWDGRELAEKYPKWAAAVYGTRGTATNHIIGDGWWAWFIPLKGGDVSVGLVYDQRLVELPSHGGTLGERLKQFLCRHPVAREMLEDAEFVEEDVNRRKNLAYSSTKYAGDGFALVGDAAAFMDPFYSPGMDWISFTTSSAADLISEQFQGRPIQDRLEKHNRDFTTSYERWFKALYKDKYYYMGEYDLMELAFRLDLSLYYWGVVEPVFHGGDAALLAPPFSPPSGKIFSTLISCYNRRFVRIACRRREEGRLGRTNDGRRSLIPGFTLDRKDTRRLFSMLGEWAMLELREGWRSWGDPVKQPQLEARPLAVAVDR
jgi:flavin-dependent dehydrogenase